MARGRSSWCGRRRRSELENQSRLRRVESWSGVNPAASLTASRSTGCRRSRSASPGRGIRARSPAAECAVAPSAITAPAWGRAGRRGPRTFFSHWQAFADRRVLRKTQPCPFDGGFPAQLVRRRDEFAGLRSVSDDGRHRLRIRAIARGRMHRRRSEISANRRTQQARFLDRPGHLWGGDALRRAVRRRAWNPRLCLSRGV
jgi:hypothetical protein